MRVVEVEDHKAIHLAVSVPRTINIMSPLTRIAECLVSVLCHSNSTFIFGGSVFGVLYLENKSRVICKQCILTL